MPADRLVRILGRLARDRDSEMPSRLCVVSADVTRMSGAGIMLMLDDQPFGSVCTSNETSTTIEELQYTLGEGPCVDAHHLHQPVAEPDLADPVEPRWAGFTGPAVEAGARAVFGFPIAVGALGLGALNLYRDRPGPLTADQHADALVLADIAARSILGMQIATSSGGASSGSVVDVRAVVHQAAGMISVQFGTSVSDALAMLRAYAFSHDRPIDEVARDVTGRRLRFDRPDADGSPD